MAYDGKLLFDTGINTEGFQRDASRLSDIVGGMGVFKLFEKGFQMVANSVDKALGRIDTMEQFDRVMTTITGDVGVTNAALEETNEIVKGTAYGLDVASRSVQNFVSRGMEVQGATETVRAWGDAVAFYGDGSNATFASVTDALSKMQTKGTVTMEHMEMLLNAGIPAIEMYADAMGMTATEVTEAMSAGEISASGFITTMNSAITNGTSKFPSLTGAAKEAGASWSASFDNMGAAIARGVQSIITSIDETQEALGRPTMRDAIAKFGSMFETALKGIATVIPPVLENIDLLAIGVGGLWAVMKAYTIIGTVSTAYKGLNAVITATKATMAASQALVMMDATSHTLLTAALASEATAEKVRAAAKAKGMTIDAAGNLITSAGTAATAAETAAVLASSGALTAKTVVVGLLSGGISIVTAAQWAWNAAMAANPIGAMVALVIGAAAAIAALGVALYKMINQETEAYKEQSAAVDELTTATDDLISSQESSAKSYADTAKSIKTEGEAARQLISQIDTLANKENRTAAEKAQLATYVEQLNAAYDGLNLAYDEENDLLSMNTEQVAEYISAKQTMEESNALIERQNQLYQEEISLQENIQEIEAKQAELDAQLEERVIKQSEYNELMEELSASQEEAHEREKEIAAEKAEMEAQLMELDTEHASQIVENAEAVAAAEEEEMQRRTDALAAYTEAATNMFDRIDTESELSVNDMIANLEHNQAAVAQWADNLVLLGERGLNQGLLQQLRDAGPEAAGNVAALASATDEQLAHLSEVFANGGEVAVQALMAELGLPDVAAAGTDMVDDVANGVSTNKSLETATVQMIQKAKTAASNQVTASNFGTIGTQMINGIIQAINNGSSALVAAMVNAAVLAYNATKSRLQINSPSRLFEMMIGLMTMRGWTRGVARGTPELLRQMHQTTRAMIETAADGTTWREQAAQTISAMRAGVAANSMRFAYAGAASGGVADVIDAAHTEQHTQNIYFMEPMQAPDEIARALRIEQTSGLAGDRNG